MSINKYIEEIDKDFIVYTSLEDEEWYPFEPNTTNQQFLIRRKL